jgi:amino acid adenylation domain-containing protein/thioester reductase-like protein
MRDSDYSGRLIIAASQNIKERDYWLKQFSGFTGKSVFPYDSTSVGKVVETLTFRFPQELCSRIMSISKTSDYRIHMILVTGIVLLLYRYTNLDDIIVGIPIYKQEIEGELINTILAIRNSLHSDIKVKELLIQVSKTIYEAEEHQNYPLETLLYKLNMEIKENDFPLFDIVILLDTIHDRNYLGNIQPNMIFNFSRIGEEIKGSLEYNALLYQKTTVEGIIDHLQHLLHNALNDVNYPLHDVEIMSVEEKKRVLIDFNGKRSEVCLDKSICQWIEEYGEKTPDHIAAKDSKRFIAFVTYKELNNKSEQLAYRLRQEGVDTDNIVGIMMNRSLEMVISIIAIWKTGSAYIPIDPEYPEERRHYMLADSGARVLLKKSEIAQRPISKFETNLNDRNSNDQNETSTYIVLNFEHLNFEFVWSLRDFEFRASNLRPLGLAYIIYTSGSTGKPKGAMVEHIGMMNHMAAKIHDLRLTGECIIAQNASHTFDISVWQFFAAMIVGGQTIIYPDGLVLEPDRFISLLIKDRVNILEVVPSFLGVILDYIGEEQPVPLNLEYLLVTGEEIKPGLVKRWFRKYPQIPMVNAYGPTEASDDITHYIMDDVPDMEHIPIGKPLQNFNIYVVNEWNQLCPVGVKGEIWVSGIGVGRGYLNNPELTAEKFDHDLWDFQDYQDEEKKGASKGIYRNYNSYKTGDLGRWLPDGTLDFFGRKDFQVKIRGFRIELGEIENRLVSHEAVKEGVVTAKEDENGNRYLCAYVVPCSPHSTYSPYLPNSLREYLAKHLPDYMVPTHFVQLEQMPLTPSGKINRSALPEPDISGHQHHGMPYITEAMLTQVKVTEKQVEKNENRVGQFTFILPGPERELPYDRKKTLHQLFAEQAARTPNHTAVVFMLSHLTFGELNRKSDGLACLLREKGVRTGDIVALEMENSIEMVIGILGILKSGGAYLSIGLNYPQKRIDFMLKDSNARFLLKKSEIRISESRRDQTDSNDQNSNDQNKIITPIVLNFEHLNFKFTSNFEFRASNLSSFSLAHIFYTSGTTGRPKGIMAEHCHVHNAVIGLYERIYKQYNQKLNLALLTPFYFDGFIKQTFGALFYGHTLCIVPEDSRFDGDELLDFYETYRIDISDGSPTHIRLLLESMKDRDRLPGVKHFISAGDVLPKKTVEDFFNVLRKKEKGIPKITNLYGPTECCVDSTSYEVSSENIGLHDEIPIGKALPNEQVYILNKENKPMSLGEAGELYIGGDGVTRGYLNNPEFTKERFQITNSKSHITNETQNEKFFNKKFLWGPGGSLRLFIKRAPGRRRQRIYKTGDFTRWLADGNIGFIGRKDNQVQIAGVRIEPEEIEKALIAHEAVNQVVVAAREEMGEKYLCAFVVFRDGRTFPTSMELKEFLYGRLPDYMLPSVFVRLEKVPLTPNGKMNRKILQAVEIPFSHLPGKEYEPPADQVEHRLVELWEEVLNTASPGVRDNFFDLGGHSLKAVILLSKIHKTFNVRVTLAELFREPTIRGLAGFLKKAKDDLPGNINKRVDIYIPLEPVEKREYYPVSSAQKRLYILQQMEAIGIAYNLPQVVPFTGYIHKDLWRLEQAFRRLIQRHESLRTSFLLVDNEPVQRIYVGVEFEIEVRCGSPCPPVEVEKTIQKFIRPFDLSQAPLLRVGLIRTEDDNYLLMLDMHHIISDGFSHNILVKDFMTLYAGKQLPSLKLQYKDYSQWQNREKQGEKFKQQETFWLKEFLGEIPQVNLPLDYSRPAVQSFEGRMVGFTIEEADTRDLKSLVTNEGVTLYMVVLAIFNVLLSKISGSHEVIIGTAVAGRWHADLQEIIGMFVNTLSLCNSPGEDKPFNAFLKEIKKRTVEAFENQEYPFEDLVEKVTMKRDAGRNPLFDVMLNFQSPDFQPGTKLQIRKPEDTAVYFIESRIAKFDLTLTAVDMGNHLLLAFEYCSKLFKKETIQRWANYFKLIISSILENMTVMISQIEMIPESEKQQILYDFNDTTVDYPGDRSIHEIFREQVQKTPDLIAVVGVHELHELHEITYSEINKKSDQLAYGLRERGVGPDVIVGIMPRHSLETVIGILAILKAGGAYLPIDPDYPDERKRYMLTDSSARVLLKKSEIAQRPISKSETNPNDRNSNGQNKISTPIVLDFEHLNFEFVSNFGFRASNFRPLGLAYVLYTSGSTGRPKGVMVEHRNVVRLVKNTNYIEFTERDRILQTGVLEFDASTFEIWGALLNGLTLFLLEEEKILSPETLKTAIMSYNISTLWLTSPLFNQITSADIEVFRGLENLLVGGDVLSPFHINKVWERFPGLKVINGYGPTENTTFSATHLIDKEYKASIPIGKPIANSIAYIVDKYGYLRPIGVAGELVVGGDGVARGYLNNPELTAEKFDQDSWDYQDYYDEKKKENEKFLGVQGPFFKKVPGRRRLYKTGDLARWLSDGNIEFLGRMDQQVKIRGYRIELGEIENRLMENCGIKEGVVLAREDKNGNKYLCAFVVPHLPHSPKSLKEFLLQSLPGYMIPDYFVVVDKIPITSNGKIDRRALPEPLFHSSENYAAPRNEIEEKLIEVWGRVLGLSGAIGIHDDFFEIGGNSLRAMQIVSILIREFDISIDQIFQNPTIAELAPHLVSKRDNLLKKIQQAKESLQPQPNEKEVKTLQLHLRLLGKKHRAYVKRIEKETYPDLNEEKDYRRILITGSTGYLGSHLVYEFLSRTHALLYLLVRGQTQDEAEQRLKEKFAFYFEEGFYEANRQRLFVSEGDLRDEPLGMDGARYHELSQKVDAVVHAAANVRHFGRYEDFYKDNVKATENLLKFALTGREKDFHYISTISVGACPIPGKKSQLFTEYSHDVGQQPKGVYVKSKLEAEKKVLAYRRKGLHASIYRVGNLVSHSKTGKFQENVEDNAFYASLKTYTSLEMVPAGDESWVDLMFIDCTAEALVLLMTRRGFFNEIFHLQNIRRLSLKDLTEFLRQKGINIQLVTAEQFLTRIADRIEDDDMGIRQIIDRYLLHSGMFEFGEEKWETANMIVSDRTQRLLSQLGFEWPEVSAQHIRKMIDHCREVGFIE